MRLFQKVLWILSVAFLLNSILFFALSDSLLGGMIGFVSMFLCVGSFLLGVKLLGDKQEEDIFNKLKYADERYVAVVGRLSARYNGKKVFPKKITFIINQRKIIAKQKSSMFSVIYEIYGGDKLLYTVKAENLLRELGGQNQIVVTDTNREILRIPYRSYEKTILPFRDYKGIISVNVTSQGLDIHRDNKKIGSILTEVNSPSVGAHFRLPQVRFLRPNDPNDVTLFCLFFVASVIVREGTIWAGRE